MSSTETITVPNMTVDEMYRAIVFDFEASWAALAAHGSGGGNFMFGRQAMTLLEWACRLSATDSSGAGLSALTEALRGVEPRYFTVMPGPCRIPGDFVLPHDPASGADRMLLSLIFDLVRHGGAHQYQQITAALSDGYLVVSMTGTTRGFTLDVAARNRGAHLGVGTDSWEDGKPIVYIMVRPELLFLDVKAAIETSGLLQRGLSFDHLRRGGPDEKKARYSYDCLAVRTSLEVADHDRVLVKID